MFGAMFQKGMFEDIFRDMQQRQMLSTSNLANRVIKYALIDEWSVNERDSREIIRQYERDLAQGLSFNDGHIFVFKNNLPRQDFADYVALHEQAEIETDSHKEACRIELSEVFKKDNEFINAYANWLVGTYLLNPNGREEGYFKRAINGFYDKIKSRKISDKTKILQEFKRKLVSKN